MTRKSRRNILGVLFVAALVVGLLVSTGCAAPAATPTAAPQATSAPKPTAAAPQPTAAAPQATAAAPTSAQKPIRIGTVIPLSGKYSETGKWVEKGYRWFVEEKNAKGGLLGRPIELIVYDDQSTMDKSVNLLEKLITVDKVDLLIGGYSGDLVAAQMPIAEKYKMVYVSQGGHMPSFSQGFKYNFGGPPLMGQWWYEGFFQLIASLPQDKRPKAIAAMTANNIIGQACRESIVNNAKKLNIPMVMDELYDLPLNSADPLVAKAKATGADVFFANGFFDDGVLTVRSMKALGYNPAFFVQGVGSVVPNWVKELGPDANYVFSGTAMHSKLPYPGMAELNKVAQEKFGEKEAPVYFCFGYCWMQVLTQGVEGAGKIDQDAIRDWLRNNEVKTVGGSWKFDERGLPPPYSYLTQVIDGKVELVWPKEVQSHEPIFPKPAWGQ